MALHTLNSCRIQKSFELAIHLYSLFPIQTLCSLVLILSFILFLLHSFLQYQLQALLSINLLLSLISTYSEVIALVALPFYLFFFNWRIIAFQCCVGFCHTSVWISHKYTYVASRPPPRLSQSTGFSSLCYMAVSHQLSILQVVYIYFSATLSIHPMFSFPRFIYKSVLYVCISIPALQIGSSVQFF